MTTKLEHLRQATEEAEAAYAEIREYTDAQKAALDIIESGAAIEKLRLQKLYYAEEQRQLPIDNKSRFRSGDLVRVQNGQREFERKYRQHSWSNDFEDGDLGVVRRRGGDYNEVRIWQIDGLDGSRHNGGVPEQFLERVNRE